MLFGLLDLSVFFWFGPCTFVFVWSSRIFRDPFLVFGDNDDRHSQCLGNAGELYAMMVMMTAIRNASATLGGNRNYEDKY